MSKLMYNVSELSAILGFTVSAIHAHLARKNFDAVPPPIRLGRRLAWPVESVNQWLDAKLKIVLDQNLARDDQPKGIVGRPRRRCGLSRKTC